MPVMVISASYLALVTSVVGEKYCKMLRHRDVDFWQNPQNEQQARGYAGLMIGEARFNLDIVSGKLNARVWDEKLAQNLIGTLSRRPQLQVRLLTAQEIMGQDDSSHPFYNACLANPDRVTLATLDSDFPIEGIEADGNTLRKLGLSKMELVPAVTYLRQFDSDTQTRLEADFFRKRFDLLWGNAKYLPAQVIPQTA